MLLKEKILKLEPIELVEHVDECLELKELQNCVLDNNWWDEGNILEHTNLVMQEAFKICQEIQNSAERVNLYLASLLHDIGKVNTVFKKDNGKIVICNHEQVGTTLARDFLRKYFPEFGFARREYILSLVEYHEQPVRMLKNLSSDLRFKQLSLEVNTEQVHNIAMADFNGRIRNKPEIIPKYLMNFKNKCRTLNIWGKRWEILNTKHLDQHTYNLIRWNILFNGASETNIEKVKKLVERFQKKPFALLLMCGANKSGKTSYIDKWYPHIEKICMDVERAKLTSTGDTRTTDDYIFQLCCKKLHERMKNQQNIIWDVSSINRRMRRLPINIARQNGAMVGIIYFDLPLDIILQRNQMCERKVPEDVIRYHYRRLQVPKPYEYDQLIVVNEYSKLE